MFIGDICKDIVGKPDFSYYMERVVVISFIDPDRKNTVGRFIGVDNGECIFRDNNKKIFRIASDEIDEMGLLDSFKKTKLGRFDELVGRIVVLTPYNEEADQTEIGRLLTTRDGICKFERKDRTTFNMAEEDIKKMEIFKSINYVGR